jgi:hypothetical protein
MRAGKMAERGGGFISITYAPGAVATDATSRLPTNSPPLARLIAVKRLTYGTNGTITQSNLAPVAYTGTLGNAGEVALKDYRTLVWRPASTAKQTVEVLARLAPEGYTGSAKAQEA